MKPSLVLFLGAQPCSPAEGLVVGAQRAVLLDTLERASASGAFDRAVVVTNRPDTELARLAELDLDQPTPDSPFRFGQRLAEVVRHHHLCAVVYVGGGAAPLFPAAGLTALAQQVAECPGTAIANNLYSTDFVGFSPASALDGDGLPERDNGLAQWFAHTTGFTVRTLPRTAATQFDIDTPTDLLILQAHSGCGQHARAYLDSLALASGSERLRRAMAVLRDVNGELVVAGRVGSHTWQALEAGTSCRVRLFAEERGMAADGREARGEARSLLGLHLERVGIPHFFQELASLGQAALIDSRVLFAHLRRRLSPSDRYLSDLGAVAQIEDPWLREFTQAALEAPIPVVLGGHSLVSGGMLALIEAAQQAPSPVPSGNTGGAAAPPRR